MTIFWFCRFHDIFVYNFFSSFFISDQFPTIYHLFFLSVKYQNSIVQIKKLFLYSYRSKCILFKSFSRSCELISQIRCPDMTQPWSWRKICKYILCFGYCRTNMQHRLPIIDRRWIWRPRKNFVQSRPCGLAFIRIFVYDVICWVLSMRRCGMKGIKGYISIREASYRLGVSERRVNQYCAEGRISGAARFGRSWALPENAEKPSDPRRKATEGGGGYDLR